MSGVVTDQRERLPLLQTGATALLLFVAILGRDWIRQLLDGEAARTWCTMFVAIVVQSTPFLVGGVLLSACISRFLSERLLQRVLPTSPMLAVPVAGIAGLALPGCECAAVPVSEGLMRRGVPAAAALTFLLAAPAINPAVIVSTWVAFPNNHLIAFLRIGASLATAVLVGWWCLARGDRLGMTRRKVGHEHGDDFLATTLHDFLHAGGFLVLGAMAAAAVNTFVPRSIVDGLAGQFLVSILTMAAFAFIAALCSESDAFVAASLTSFSDTAKLTFLVVGPAMDIKLAAMESGQFGMRFTRQFVPIVLIVAICTSVVAGWVFL